MSCPRVTVVLTSYNHEAFLAKSIESILDQTFDDFELVIIDDASVDSSQGIIRKYAAQDSRIRYVFHEHNLGTSALLDLLDSFNGEYVAMAHSDDMWMPDKLEKQVAFLDSHDDYAACFTAVEIIGDDDESIVNHPYADVFLTDDMSRFEWLRHFFFKGNAFCHPSMLIRKHAYIDYSMNPIGLSGLPDMSNWIKVLAHAEVKVLPEKLTQFRVHADESNTSGITIKSQNRLSSELFLLLKSFMAIESIDDLMAVFPEASEYVVGRDYSREYIFAMMALKAQRPQWNMFAINILFDLLQDKEQNKKLKRLYGFTHKTFTDLKFKYQTFPIPYSFHNASVYLSAEKGVFSEESKLTRTYAMSGNMDTVTLKWETKYLSGEKRYIRFDPIEGEPTACKLKSFKVDGREFPLSAQNSSSVDEDGNDLFFTLDPMYSSSAELTFGDVLEAVFDIAIMDKSELISELQREAQTSSALRAEIDGRLLKRVKNRIVRRRTS